MERARWIVVAVAATLLVIVILQNMAYVQTRILLINVSMPQAVLLAVIFALGYVVGALTGGKMFRWKR